MTEDGKYVLKYEGKEVPVSIEELYQKASLAEGAQRRMQEAADLRKRAEEAQRQTAQLVTAIDQGDAEAYDTLVDMMDISPVEKASRKRAYRAALAEAAGERSSAGEEEEEEGEEEDVSERSQRRPASRSQASPESIKKLQRALEMAEAMGDYTPDQVKFLLDHQRESYFEQERRRVLDDLEKGLASDSDVGRIIEKGGSRAEAVKGLAQELLIGRLRTQQYTPDVRAAVLGEVKRYAKELGVGGGSTSLPGLGASPGVSISETQAHKPPERKATDDQAYTENVLARMAHTMQTEPD